jgi:phospholipid/cholesterol/gamma-HCH transport system permease protein
MSPPHRKLQTQAPGDGGSVAPARVVWSADRRTLSISGSWTTAALAHLGPTPAELDPSTESVILDGSGLTGLDTAGALLVHRLVQRLREQGRGVELAGFGERRSALLDLVAERLAVETQALEQQGRLPRPSGLERLGRLVVERGREGFALLSFCGEVCLAFVQSLLHPARFRWRYVLAVLEHDGVRSIPVLAMLSFLLGVVIAYQAGVQFRVYGGNLYVVDLVGVTVLRELGPLMTAIVVAGRSGSAYTAQIGTMQVTEEVDAMRSIGVSPLDLLVLPKILGLVIALPLLTVFADVAAVGGGMVMSALMLDVSPDVFLRRFPEAVSINSLLTGVAKAPVFAAAIATVGCYQGFQVRGGADSVGRHTTVSVVQALVSVIALDAAFSIAYSWLGI